MGSKESGEVYDNSVIAKQLLDFGQEWQNRLLSEGDPELERIVDFQSEHGTRGNTFALVYSVLQRWE